MIAIDKHTGDVTMKFQVAGDMKIFRDEFLIAIFYKKKA